MFLRSRSVLFRWLLAGGLLVSVSLNVYCLAPGNGAPLSAWWADVLEDDDWDDLDDDEPYANSRAALADELRRTRLLLEQCQDPAPKPSLPSGHTITAATGS